MSKLLDIILGILGLVSGVIGTYLLSKSIFYNSLKTSYMKKGLDTNQIGWFMKWVAKFFKVYDNRTDRIIVFDVNDPKVEKNERKAIYEPFWGFVLLVLSLIFSFLSNFSK